MTMGADVQAAKEALATLWQAIANDPSEPMPELEDKAQALLDLVYGARQQPLCWVTPDGMDRLQRHRRGGGVTLYGLEDYRDVPPPYRGRLSPLYLTGVTEELSALPPRGTPWAGDPVWGVFNGKEGRLHFSIGPQTFDVGLAMDEADPEHEHHRDLIRSQLEVALRRLSGRDPAPLDKLANGSWLAEGSP